MCLFGPRSEELRKVEACRLRRLLRDGLRLWLLLGLLDRALRSSCGRGRGLFFRLLLLVLSNELGLLVSERVGNLAAGIAEVELQDRLADVLMDTLQRADAER